MAHSNYIKPPIKTSATMAINAKINELMEQGHRVYHLGFGEARFPVHPKILAAFQQNAAARSYLPIAGLPKLRAQVADYYHRKFKIKAEAKQVIVGSGSKTLLFAAMHALQGDVLLPSPTWVSYDTQAQLTGKAVHWMKTRLENNFCLTPDDLKAGLSAAREAGQSPAILVLNSPGNPTGVVYPPDLLAGLAQVAQAENLTIISDEIYSLTTYGQTPHISMAHYYPEGTIVTGGLSKHLSLGGWRLGVAILPSNNFGAELHQYMTAVAGAIWTTAAAPVQYAAVIAYSDDPEIDAYMETCTTIHGYITQYLHNALKSLNVPCPAPGGGFYVYPSFAPWREALAKKHNIHTSQELANFLLDEEHMATLPGSDFGADPQELTLRLSTSYLYGFSDESTRQMLAVFNEQLPIEEFLQKACPSVIEVGEKFKAFIASLE